MHLDNFTIRDQIKNCLKLAEKLDTVDREHYNQGAFFSRKDEGKKVTISKIHDCGTSACALGHAATMRYFQNRGICYEIVENADGDLHGNSWISYEINIDTDAWDNAADVFGLERDDRYFSDLRYENTSMTEMFGSKQSVIHKGTPKSVARALRKHVKDLEERLG